MKRRRLNEGLPKYVYRRRGWYVYRPYLGRRSGKTVWGSDQRLVRDCEPLSEVWAAYARMQEQEQSDTVRWLLLAYHKSPAFQRLSPKSREEYERYFMAITGRPTRNGKTMGEMPLGAVKKTTIRAYLDSYPAPIAANRHIQYFKAAWNWAEQRYEQVPSNPCAGVGLNRSAPRSRYVSPEEFDAFKQMAGRTSYIPAFMELAYLCRARWGEVANMKVSDCHADGLLIRRGKGSESEITAWTPRLREAVNAAQMLNKDAPTPLSGAYLIHDRRGLPIKRNAFQSAWQRLMAKWDGEHFTFHDLKAAGYSDQKVQDAGHRSEKMHKVYNRKLRVVQPPGGE